MVRLAAILMLALAAFPAAAQAVETKTISKTAPRFQMTIAYPATGNAMIDADIAAFAQRFADEFGALADEAASDEYMVPEASYEGELMFEVRRDDAEVFAVAFTWYTYTGGAHPNSSLHALNYLKSAGRRITIEELVGPQGIKQISDAARADLKPRMLEAAEGFIAEDMFLEGTEPNPENFEAFTWYPDRLHFDFSPYQVAPYAVGPQEATVPLAKVTLRPDPLAPLASFDCAKAGNPSEKAICADWQLGRLDRQLAARYRFAMSIAFEPAEKDALKTAQREWLKARNACAADTACIAARINARLQALDTAPL